MLIGFVLLCGASNAIAQPNSEVYLINSTNGISNNRINDIFQDSKGYMWFATDDGLNRYDGYEFVVYRPDIHDPKSIASAKIYSISEDMQGNIWVGTDKGISKRDILNKQFLNVTFYPREFGYSGNEIYDIEFMNDSSLWCFMRNGLILYNIIREDFLEYNFDSRLEGDPLASINVLFYSKNHRKLLLGTDKGLVILDPETGNYSSASLKETKIYDIFQDRNGSIYLGSEIGLSKCLWSDTEFLPDGCEILLENTAVKGIAQIEKNRLAVLTAETTLLFDHYTNQIIREDIFSAEKSPDLSSSSKLFFDNSRNIWIATSKGIYFKDIKALKFSNLTSRSPTFTLDHDMISSVLASGSMLYLGSWGGGFQVLNLNTGKELFYSNKSPIYYYPEEGVNVIFQDKKNRLWVIAEGMYEYQAEKEKFVPVDEILKIQGIGEIKGSRIYDIVEPVEGFMVIGHSKGVYIIDENNSAFDNISYIEVDSMHIPLSEVSAVEYSPGFLWFGTEYGVIQYSLEDNHHLFYPNNKSYGLADRILCMKIDLKNKLWVGTPSGLFRLDEEKRYFQGFSVKDGFTNDFIYSIEEDNNGILWLSTNKGIVSFDPDNYSIRNFGVQHGLSCMEFNLNASFYTKKGIMFFGGVEGVNYFNPDSLTSQNALARTLITGYRHFSRDTSFYESLIPNRLSMKDNESLQLFFALLDFGEIEYKSFRYRVMGSKESGVWHNIGTQNSVIISGLDHGKYLFQVVGSNKHGQWSSEPTSIILEIIAPIYRRKFFVIIMFLPLLFLIYFLFEYRTKTLKKSNRALRDKEIVAKEVLKQKNLLSSRTKNIEDSLKYAQRIQFAMFTSESEIRKMFPESFIVQMPKDIVSGDFYWGRKIGNKIFLAVADCTGHGVPGAFMSLIGLEFFRQIIEIQKVYTPSMILKEINKNFDLIFGNTTDLNMRDGMDLAFCVIDTQTNILEFSGAFNPLYIIRDGEIIEIKGDKNILGPDLGFGRSPFSNHSFQLQKHDVLYMFSDGYVDQFGGPEGKKFKQRRFRHLLLSLYNQSMQIQKDVLENSFLDWKGDTEQIDDILVVGVKPIF